MLNSKSFSVIALVIGAVSVLTALFYGSILFSLISALLVLFAAILWKYGYFLIPYFTRWTNIIEIREGHEIGDDRKTIIKRTNQGYFATRFLGLEFLDSDSKAEERMKKFLTSLKYVCKVSFLLSPLDLSAQIDEIKTLRSIAEAEREKVEDPNSADARKLDRKISMLNKYLDRLSKGDRAMEIVAFVSTTAFGLTRDEAVSRASRQAQDLKALIGGALNCSVRELSDLELIRCFEYEYFVPLSSAEMESEVF